MDGRVELTQHSYVVPVQQNLRAGLQTHTLRRPTRHESVFFHVITYDRAYGATKVGRFLNAVFVTLYCPVTKITNLIPGLTQLRSQTTWRIRQILSKKLFLKMLFSQLLGNALAVPFWHPAGLSRAFAEDIIRNIYLVKRGGVNE